MTARLLLLLVLLQGGCLAESALDEADLQCGPRDFTVECCLKKNPGQWERCTGSPGPAESGLSGTQKAIAAATAVAVALQPRINSAERRGVELAVNLRTAVEDAILRCTRRADREANEDFFDGRSPSPEECRESKREGQTWAMYLGVHKHHLAKQCLQEALGKLMPGRFLLEARFLFKERTGQWEYLDKEAVDRLVSQVGRMALEGSIAPDIVIMDDKGVIILVYDMKFPCPESNGARWDFYSRGPWALRSQDEIYFQALRSEPLLVSPQEGVQRREGR
ncbi:hypothetical protein ACLESO_25000 [Pyxidicoccus sp. 3LG]